MFLFIVATWITFSCLGQNAGNDTTLPLETAALLSELRAAGANDASSTLTWIKEKGLTGGRSRGVLGTTRSGSSAGKHRIIYFDNYGKNLLSIFPSGKIELLSDTGSDRGFLPIVLRKESADGINHELRPVKVTGCANCHSRDFTPIWNVESTSGFSGGPLRAPLDRLESERNVFSRETFVNELVRKAANNLFHKIVSRHPERFKKHAPLLLRLLMNCNTSESEWSDFLQEVQKNAPGLVKQWSKLFAGWHTYVRKMEADARGRLGIHYTTKGSALYPLFMIHYLGVPPHNIFLFRPLEREGLNPAESEAQLFDSMDEFSSRLEQKDEEFRVRWGPLGAYGGQNDDIRGFLAAHISKDVFSKMDFNIRKNEYVRFDGFSRSNFSRADIERFLEGHAHGLTNEEFKKMETYIYDSGFPFNLSGVYGDYVSNLPAPKPEDRRAWCDQLTFKNADFSFMGESSQVKSSIENESKTHSQSSLIQRR